MIMPSPRGMLSLYTKYFKSVAKWHLDIVIQKHTLQHLQLPYVQANSSFINNLEYCNYQRLEYHNLMSIHFYDIGNFFSSYLTTCGFQFFLSFHFLFAHTLKQPHKCHYKIENTPSFLYTSVQAKLSYS